MPVTGLTRARPRPFKPRSGTIAKSLAQYAKRQVAAPPPPPGPPAPRPNDDDSGDEAGAGSGDEGGPHSDDESSPPRPPAGPPRPPNPLPTQPRPPTVPSDSAATVTVTTFIRPSPPDTRESTTAASSTDTSYSDAITTGDSTDTVDRDDPATASVPGTLAPNPTSTSDQDEITPQGNLSSSSPSSPSPGAVAGIVIAVLIVVGIAAFFFIRRKFVQKRINQRSLWTVRPFSGGLSSTRDGSSISPSDSASRTAPRMLEAGYGGVAAIPNPYSPSQPPMARTLQSAYASSRPGSQNSQITAQTVPSFYVRGNSTYSDPFEGGVPAAVAGDGPKTKTVKHFYIPERQDEMAVQLGTVLRVLAEYDDGWALCENPQTRQQGMVPLACFGGPHIRVDSPTLDEGALDSGDDGEYLRPPTALVDKSRLSKRASSLASPFVTGRE